MVRLIMTGLLASRLRLILTAVTIALGTALMAGTFMLNDSVRAALGTSTQAAVLPGCQAVRPLCCHPLASAPLGPAGLCRPGRRAALPSGRTRRPGPPR
jgi:hypothetical protein